MLQDITFSKKETPVGAIIVYRNDVLYHPISNNKIKAARPLSRDGLRSMLKFIDRESEDFTNYGFNGYIPRSVLSYNDEGDIVFMTPKMRKHMLFRDEDIADVEYNIPALIWKLQKKSLKVYAIKKFSENLKFKIYNAPFFNISEDGSVCMGNASFTKSGKNFTEMMDHVQDQFFNSVFTHTNNNSLATENILSLYEKAKSKSFSWDQYLVQSKKTFEEICTL